MSVAYEKFVWDVYQSLVKQDAVANVDVRHNVKLRGKSGATHQIDVYWAFEIAGQRYQTCIECKYYGTNIKKSHVAAFAKVLDDVGNANGTFVTTAGYQTGAKLLAANTNIRLLLVVPTIAQIEIHGVIDIPHVRNFVVEFDRDACRPVLEAAGRRTFDLETIGGLAKLRTQSGDELTMEQALKSRLGNDPGPVTLDLSDLSLATEIGWMPLKRATCDLSFDKHEQTIVLKGLTAGKAVIEDVLANTKAYVDHMGRLVSTPDAAQTLGEAIYDAADRGRSTKPRTPRKRRQVSPASAAGQKATRHD